MPNWCWQWVKWSLIIVMYWKKISFLEKQFKKEIYDGTIFLSWLCLSVRLCSLRYFEVFMLCLYVLFLTLIYILQFAIKELHFNFKLNLCNCRTNSLKKQIMFNFFLQQVDHERNLWILSDKLPHFTHGKLDHNQTNYRIMKISVEEAIKDTVCL